MDSTGLLSQFMQDLSSVVPDVGAEAYHNQWDDKMGPSEEENQLSMRTKARDEERSTVEEQ